LEHKFEAATAILKTGRDQLEAFADAFMIKKIHLSAPPVPTQNSKCPKNSIIFLAFGVLSSDRQPEVIRRPPLCAQSFFSVRLTDAAPYVRRSRCCSPYRHRRRGLDGDGEK
jgi:hypothetical protein